MSNELGTVWSRSATLTVTANQVPTETITPPAASSLFSAGEVLQLAGSGSDPEDGALPPTAFTWEVDLHHKTHVHGTVSMTQGQRCPIQIAFTDGNGSASLHLTYGPDDARRSVLAGSQLYPAP